MGYHGGERTVWAMAKAVYALWISPEGLEKVTGWAKDGLTDVEIAEKIGVSRKTLYEWAKNYEAFGEALARSRTKANRAVEGALYKRAVGYTTKVKKNYKLREVKYDQTGKKLSEKERLVTAYDEVHVPADVGAQKFWLANREPEEWRNREPEGPAAGGGSLEEFLRRFGGTEEP